MTSTAPQLTLPVNQSLRVAKVVVLAPMDSALDYLIPEGMDVQPGDHVQVPLGHAKVRGLVIGFEDAPDEDLKLKPIHQRLDDPPVPEASLTFWLWAAQWTLTPPGVFLVGCLRALRATKGQVRMGYVRSDQPPSRMTRARERVLETAVLPMGLSELAFAAGVSPGVVTGLVMVPD